MLRFATYQNIKSMIVFMLPLLGFIVRDCLFGAQCDVDRFFHNRTICNSPQDWPDEVRKPLELSRLKKAVKAAGEDKLRTFQVAAAGSVSTHQPAQISRGSPPG